MTDDGRERSRRGLCGEPVDRGFRDGEGAMGVASLGGNGHQCISLKSHACDPYGERPVLYRKRYPYAATTNGGHSRTWSVIRVCEEVFRAKGGG